MSSVDIWREIERLEAQGWNEQAIAEALVRLPDRGRGAPSPSPSPSRDCAIPRSRENPKILWVDDSEVVRDSVAVGRPSRTWGCSRRAPERTAGPPFGDSVIPLKCPVGGRGPNLQHQMSASW